MVMESAGKRRRDSVRCALESGAESEGSLAVLGCSKMLELEGVIKLLRMYDTCTGPEIICCVCGKPYKSKVCFTKHVWEHSVYWDTFDGFKNHERVLSIQAAIILTHMQELSFLLVTGPNVDKKKGTDSASSPSSTTSREVHHPGSSGPDSDPDTAGSPGSDSFSLARPAFKRKRVSGPEATGAHHAVSSVLQPATLDLTRCTLA